MMLNIYVFYFCFEFERWRRGVQNVYILSENSALARFCVDLTARASEGFIDPIFGRDSEVERVVEILCRRTKNNPILIGESGVGKTAIAEGLALSIAQADAPFVLLVRFLISV